MKRLNKTWARSGLVVLAAVLGQALPMSSAGAAPPVIVDIEPHPNDWLVDGSSLNEVVVTFDQVVIISAADVVARLNPANCNSCGPPDTCAQELMDVDVAFNAGTMEATITFNTPVASPQRATLIIDHTMINTIGEALDGEIDDPRNPDLSAGSGDGNEGGPAVFQFSVLHGDLNHSGSVNGADIGPLQTNDGCCDDPGDEEPGACTGAYDADLDLNGDGCITQSGDGLILAPLFGTSIPSAGGTPPSVTGIDPLCLPLANDEVSVTFSEEMDPRTVTRSSLFATDSGGDFIQPDAVPTTGDNTTFVYTFTGLPDNVDYFFTLSNSITDGCNDLLGSSQFTLGTTDSDCDGVLDGDDNCPDDPNTDQSDANMDGQGDACDPDTDGDGIDDDGNNDGMVGNMPCTGGAVNDCDDNCRMIDNPLQEDMDSDGVGDVCDNCPADANADQMNGDADGLGDVCDNCPNVTNPDQADMNGDDEGDACDDDIDGDTVANADDNCPEVANADQTNTDMDERGDACDADDDNDGVMDAADPDALDPFVCGLDADGDGCDDCTGGGDVFGELGNDDPNDDGADTDTDGACNFGDADDDNDGAADDVDPAPLDPTVCGVDSDEDGCDDCTNGVDGFGPLADDDAANDGLDTDNDGLCNAGDDDDDNDGVVDGNDPDALNPNVCGVDEDGDGCDDCTVGVDGFGPLADDDAANDGLDTDGDGLCNDGDDDDDNDGVIDANDPEPLNPDLCGLDADGDGCDDCAGGGDGFGPDPNDDVANDGLDTDADGACDLGDEDDDNDGVQDGADPEPLNPDVCGLDTDADGCDDCAGGGDGFGPNPNNDPTDDGTDTDGDGACNLGDDDDDNDGVLDAAPDPEPLDPTVCGIDMDGDGCDDCTGGGDLFGPDPNDDPDDDGLDTDGDGACNAGDDDDDNDGVPDAEDADAVNPNVCADDDNDGCDDCAVGVDGFGPMADNDVANDGADNDSDGVCNVGDNCPDAANPNQLDNDNDGAGNACDATPDGDTGGGGPVGGGGGGGGGGTGTDDDDETPQADENAVDTQVGMVDASGNAIVEVMDETGGNSGSVEVVGGSTGQQVTASLIVNDGAPGLTGFTTYTGFSGEQALGVTLDVQTELSAGTFMVIVRMTVPASAIAALAISPADQDLHVFDEDAGEWVRAGEVFVSESQPTNVIGEYGYFLTGSNLTYWAVRDELSAFSIGVSQAGPSQLPGDEEPDDMDGEPEPEPEPDDEQPPEQPEPGDDVVIDEPDTGDNGDGDGDVVEPPAEQPMPTGCGAAPCGVMGFMVLPLTMLGLATMRRRFRYRAVRRRR